MSASAKKIAGKTSQLDHLVKRYRDAVRGISCCASGDNSSQLLRIMMRVLAVMIAEARLPEDNLCRPEVSAAAECVRRTVTSGESRFVTAFDEHCAAAARLVGIDLLDPGTASLDPKLFAVIARALLQPDGTTLDLVFFQTIPLHWVGRVFELLLSSGEIDKRSDKEPSRNPRKKHGVYFTPPALVDYVIRNVLALLLPEMSSVSENVLRLRILDPAMGCGAFLVRAVELMSATAGATTLSTAIAQNCVYGVDINPTAVDIARFSVWAAAGFPDGISEALRQHLICGDALSGCTPKPELKGGGDGEGYCFDTVVGNPPYVASKNRFFGNPPVVKGTGQVDAYLLFLRMVFERGLVRQGGVLAMVLPDPVLVRENAEDVRRVLVNEWSLESILHILGAFPDASVANAVVIARNEVPESNSFTVSRVDRLSQRRAFEREPVATARHLAKSVSRDVVIAQKRCELLYLLEEEPFADVLRFIHGPRLSLSEYRYPFAPLSALNVRAIYRGEEIGKSAIVERTGDLPILLGGQSIEPYEIVWEGFRIDSARVRKPLDRYRRTKLLIQKSTGRVVAALDEVCNNHPGYVFPQSVYAVELEPVGVNHLYLLCLLNSWLMNEYVRRRATGYKLVQPQIEIEDIRALPIRRINFTTPVGTRQREVARAIGFFEEESLHTYSDQHFPKLCQFVRWCLRSSPEMSDVVHDTLVHLGRLAVDLSRKNRQSPNLASEQQLSFVRQAIEAIVYQLYTCEPAQLAFSL